MVALCGESVAWRKKTALIQSTPADEVSRTDHKLMYCGDQVKKVDTEQTMPRR
jgi:hypothetical protein